MGVERKQPGIRAVTGRSGLLPSRTSTKAGRPLIAITEKGWEVMKERDA